MQSTKICSDCGMEKPLSAFYWRKNEQRHVGRCHPCRYAYRYRYRHGLLPSRPSVEERFWKRVTVLGPDDCWLWNEGRRPSEYGRIYDGERLVGAHVFSARLAYGSPNPGQQTLHSCDVRACVNPGHLFYGTQADNVHDARRKGRFKVMLDNLNHGVGEKNPAAKLTDEQAVEIAIQCLAGASSSAVANRYGVSPRLVRSIRDGHRRPSALVKARRLLDSR